MRNLVTSGEVARVLGISRRTVAYMVSRGELEPAEKLDGPNGAFLFTREAVEALAAERRAS